MAKDKASKTKKIKVAAGNGGRKMRLPPRAKGVGNKNQKRDNGGRFA